MRDTLPVRVRFGDFELDLRTGELRYGERIILLPEQPFRVLLMLVERGSEPASREEIQKKLWPNDTVVDFDKGITAAIMKLRKALGDPADEPKYIETVGRRGYRLMVPVERVSAAGDDFPGSDGPHPRPKEEPERRTQAWVGYPLGLEHRNAAGLTGKTVSHYRVLEILGGGGMGVVYRAEDLRLGRAVALKFLPEELGDDPKALGRFEREARAASALDHPNICSIYEFGEHEGQPFMVMQLLEGQTLREHLASLALARSGSDGSCPQAFPLDQLLDVATQIADGLQAAHERGIIHRDIKPANIFLTTRGLVKILDFGVAKLTAEATGEVAVEAPGDRVPQPMPPSHSLGQFSPANSDDEGMGQDATHRAQGPCLHQPAVSVDATLTRTGTAMGTAGYMSPEQVRGEEVDARTDLFSFGLVLYEMATGQRAFGGDTAAIVREAILTQAPAPARERNSTVPPKLEQIINRAIEKDRERRYQSAAEMRADLESLAADQSKRSEGDKSRKRARWKWLAAAAVVCIAMITGTLYWRSHKPVKFTERDIIVLADFANSTGDPIFDGTLKQALSIQLEQSPYLNVLSDDKVRKTLKLMNRPANQQLTREVAQEVCLRSNSTALLAGTIAAIGDHYLIGVEAVNCQTGGTLASAGVEAENRNHVLRSVSEVTTRVREKLGESLASLQKFNQPLEEVTTSSLEALQAYTQGQAQQGDDTAALPYFKRAVELDPNFAIAYASLGNAYGYDNSLRVRYLKKAYELRDRVSQRERFKIESAYYDGVTGETEKSVRTYTEWVQSYPGDYVPHSGLVAAYDALGQNEKALDEAREFVRLRPSVGSYKPLIYNYMALNRMEDAKAALREAQTHGVDMLGPMRQMRYYLAFLEGDTASMKEQDAWAMGRPDAEPFQLQTQSAIELYHGRVGKARELSRRAEGSATRAGRQELVAFMMVSHAPAEAEIGNTSLARKTAEEALALTQGNNADIRAPAALTMALIGEIARARTLVDQMNKESPLDTMAQTYMLPTIRAEIELALNNPRRAIEILQIALPYELGDQTMPPNGVYPAYVRGLAYLKLGHGQQAAVEFQKVIDHPGIVRFKVHGALAHLQLGRAQVMMGDKIAARKSYQDFLTLWKDADSDIPIYKQAKAEYAKLQSSRSQLAVANGQ